MYLFVQDKMFISMNGIDIHSTLNENSLYLLRSLVYKMLHNVEMLNTATIKTKKKKEKNTLKENVYLWQLLKPTKSH